MEYKGLNNIRSKYPASDIGEENPYSMPQPTPKPLAQNYRKSGENVVQFTGKYPQNFINFQIRPLSDINIADVNVVEGPFGMKTSFRFIVNFKEPGQNGADDFWTSPKFYDDLKKAKDEGNPYFGFESVTVAVINYQLLANYHQDYEFFVRQNYAEVDITDTITTKDDMLLHINWMVSSDEELRPVQGQPPNILPFGAWQLRTSPSLGREWSQAVKDLDIGDLGFDVSSVPIEGLPDLILNDFDMSRFTGINDPRSSEPRSNWDYPIGYSPRGEDNTEVREDSPIVDVREENRSNQDFDGSPRGESNVTVVPIEEARSNTEYTVSPRGTSNVTVRDGTTPVTVYTRTASITETGTYYPFTSAGRYVGEVRYFDTRRYVWSGTKWENIG